MREDRATFVLRVLFDPHASIARKSEVLADYFDYYAAIGSSMGSVRDDN